MGISDLTNLYPDGLPISDGPQWPWLPLIEWHGPKERPSDCRLVLAYVRYDSTGDLSPALLSTSEFSWDEDRWWWTWDGEETVESDDSGYTVMCWCEVPPAPVIVIPPTG